MAQEPKDVLIRMHEDLQRALKKAPEDRRWVMVIDLRKCVGCHACTIACVAENKLPPGVVYRPVVEKETGTYPNVTRSFLPRPCMQCDNPPCTDVCPVSATYHLDRQICLARDVKPAWLADQADGKITNLQGSDVPLISRTDCRLKSA